MNCDHDYQATYCERCGGYTGEVCAQCGNWTDGGDYLASRADLWCDCHPDEDDEDTILCEPGDDLFGRADDAA